MIILTSSCFWSWTLISISVGYILCEAIVKLLALILKYERDIDPLPSWLSGALVGVIERLFFTIAISFSGVGPIVTGMIVWVTLKGQTHYNVFTSDEGKMNRKAAYTALIASIISMTIAMICGAQIYNLTHHLGCAG